MLLKKEKALVIFSGGQDSTTCLFWARQRFAEVIALSFDYNQKHRFELECAKAISQNNQIEHHLLDLSLLNQLSANSLTRAAIEVEKNSPFAGLPNTFVDGRNMIFLSFAAVFAKQRGIKHLVMGVSQSDYSGYPDCRDVFIKSANVTLNLAMDYEFIIHTPLMWLDKAETWKLADDLGVINIIKEETLTCYNGIGSDGCGECPACKLRENGYEKYMRSKTTEI